MGTAAKREPQNGTLDGNPNIDEVPSLAGMRLDRKNLAFARQQNGNISDDPTEDGAPVINSTPFKNLRNGK